MSQQAPKVSVIIASYCPGAALNRVIDSLDAQTLPADEFEVIFVDDGSPDDTYMRLQQIASTRPNMHVFQIPNSGWPSRPRNVGMDRAQGEYVMFMDHDDSLYPDGLRRAYEYAKENNADVLSPKESKTNDVWWGMPALIDGDIPNALVDGGIDRLLPMVPHKLYRRSMFIEHKIRFPEGSRVLWEDIFINIAAYRHAKVISVLADTPFYVWHASSSNSSHTFSPARPDFWDRLEELMTFIETTLDTPEYQDAQVTMLAHQMRGRVLDRLIRLLATAHRPAKRMAAKRARELLSRFGSEEVFGSLRSKKHLAQARLLAQGKLGLMKDFHAADLAFTAGTVVTSAEWDNGRLRLEVETRWEPKPGGPPVLKQAGGRVRLAVSRSLRRAIPAELLDVTDDAPALGVNLGLRSRTGHVTWELAYESTDAEFRPNSVGALSLVSHGTCCIDTETAALGQPLTPNVWDCRFRTEWNGRVRKGGLRFQGAVMPALIDGHGVVAYSNGSKALSFDLVQRMRTLAIDAHPRSGPAGPINGFSTPLENISTVGQGTLDADMVVAIANGRVPAGLPDDEEAEALEKLAVTGQLAAKVVADGNGARLEGSASLAAGSYTLYARRDGRLWPTARSLVVDDAGRTQFG